MPHSPSGGGWEVGRDASAEFRFINVVTWFIGNAATTEDVLTRYELGAELGTGGEFSGPDMDLQGFMTDGCTALGTMCCEQLGHRC